MMGNQDGALTFDATKRCSFKDLFGKTCPLVIRPISKVFGEGLFTNADIPLHKVIFSCFPYCCAIFPDWKKSRCSFCGKEGNLIECESCHRVVYCSERCANLDSEYHVKLYHHQQESSANNLPNPTELDPDVILLDKVINLLLSGSNGEFSSSSSFSPSHYELGNIIHLNELPTTNASERSVVLFRNDHFQTIQTVYNRNESLFTEEAMDRFLQLLDADLSRRQVSPDFIANQQIAFYQTCNGFPLLMSHAYFIITRILRKLYNNRVVIRSHQMDPCGYGIYPAIAPINHCCKPNAALVFNGNRLFLTSIRPIKAGEEITIRYFDTYRVPRIKEMIIQKRFGFECHCTSCYSDRIEDSNRDYQGLICPYLVDNEHCSGIQLPELFMNDSIPLKFTCNECKGVINTMEYMDKLIPYCRTLEIDGFLHLWDKNEAELMHDLKELNVSMSQVYHHHHAELTQVRLLLFRLYFKAGKLAAALEFGEFIRDTVLYAEELYPEYLGFIEIMTIIFNKLGVQENKRELLEELDFLRKKFYGLYYDRICL